MTLTLAGIAVAGTGAVLIVQPRATDDRFAAAAATGPSVPGKAVPNAQTGGQRVPVAPVTLALPGLDDARRVAITPVEVGPDGAFGRA